VIRLYMGLGNSLPIVLVFIAFRVRILGSQGDLRAPDLLRYEASYLYALQAGKVTITTWKVQRVSNLIG
jgi:hypothetical protein